MKVRIIGSSSAVPRPGRACSSYLIEEAGTKLVLDLGTGALQSLMRFADPRKLDAILISHLHPDHFRELVQLRYALTIPDPIDPPLPVHLPPEAEAQVARLAQSLPSSSGEAFFAGALALMEYDAENVLRIGGSRFNVANRPIPITALPFYLFSDTSANPSLEAPDNMRKMAARIAKSEIEVNMVGHHAIRVQLE